MSKRCFQLLFLLCFVIAAVCLGGLFWEWQIYSRSDQTYARIAKQKNQNTVCSVGSTAIPEASIDWEALRQEMPDFIGWISGAGLDFPIVQGKDNQYYLKHMPDQTPNSLGSVFLDAEAASDFSSPVSVIYGHYASNHRMFGVLEQYRSPAFYEENPILFLETPDSSFTVTILAAYLLDGVSETYPTSFQNETQQEQYLEEIQSRSFFQSGQSASWGDKLLILSTCAYDFDEARFAVVGRLDSKEK